MTLSAMFGKFTTIEDKEEAIAFLFSHPILMDEAAAPRLAALVAECPPHARPEAERMLSAAQRFGRAVREGGQGLPMGAGPVDQIQQRWKDGEITFDHAKALAGRQEVGDALSSFYVGALARSCEDWAQQGDWRLAVELMQLLLAAIDARLEEIGHEDMRIAAVLSWLDIAARATSDIPDGRIFFDAKRRGEALCVWAAEKSDARLHAETLHRLGVLHLDPYMAGRSTSQFGAQIQVWYGRLDETFGAEMAFWEPKEERAPPPPAEGLTQAVSYLEQAAQARVGEARARSLKALAEARLWAGVAGAESNAKAMVAEAREALETFADGGNEAMVGVLRNIIAYAGASIKDDDGDVGWAEAMLDLPDATLLEAGGVKEATNTLRQAASALERNGRFADAFALLDRASRLARGPASEAERRSLVSSQARVLAALAESHAPGLGALLDASGAARALEAAASATADRDMQERALVFLGLAAMTSACDREQEAPEIVAAACVIDPDLAETRREMLQGLLAELRLGAAVNHVNAGDPVSAIEDYTAAMARFLELEAPGTAADLLTRSLDLLDAEAPKTAVRLAVGLAQSGVELEGAIGPGGRETVQRAWRRIMANLLGPGGGSFAPDLLMIILQGAKGSGFAAAWEAWRPLTLEEEERALLTRITEARAEAIGDPEAEIERDGAHLDEHTLLGGFLDEEEAVGGGTPRTVLENLERAFDRRMHRRLTPSQRSLETLMTFEQVQRSLDARTVLMIQMLTEADDGSYAVLTVGVTAEDVFAAIGKGGMPSATISMSGTNASVKMSWLALTVAGWRAALLDEPGPADLTPEGEEALEAAAELMLGGEVAGRLRALAAAGKDHIVFAPHGALHFFPFPFLPLDGRPLADDWAVTTVPNLCILRRRLGVRASGGAAERAPFAALGLGFEGGAPHRLPPIPQAPAEARAAAERFGVYAALDAEATEPRLREALETARVVHLASHGRHRTPAPSFQAVYLSPDSGSDGVVEAWELLDLDLEGLALVGLGACETGLGRFDASDNLRGLPAALFLAGAETLVGTLWPVESRASQLFFEAFYERIAAGAERRDAFAEALRQVKASCPAYRDWGAFYLAGEWGAW